VFHQQKLTFAQLQLADCVVNLLSDAVGVVVIDDVGCRVLTFISHFYFLT